MALNGRGGSSPPPGTFFYKYKFARIAQLVVRPLTDVKVRVAGVLKNKCENSSVGRARPCQGRGRGFESRFSLKDLLKDQFLC
jgi:hypothetical protein